VYVLDMGALALSLDLVRALIRILEGKRAAVHQKCPQCWSGFLLLGHVLQSHFIL
jgi:hypothetical protein